eukprot:805153-Pyramimonas_sp.AAC.1
MTESWKITAVGFSPFSAPGGPYRASGPSKNDHGTNSTGDDVDSNIQQPTLARSAGHARCAPRGFLGSAPGTPRRRLRRRPWRAPRSKKSARSAK